MASVTLRDSVKREPRGATRERIRAIAGDLYVLHGHDGFSFGHIADAIGTTRANIHHHFGDKRQLMSELIDRFVSDAEERIVSNWTQPGASFNDRMAAQVDDLRRFYARYNPAPGDRNVWSPLSRLRLDLPVLGDLAVGALRRVDKVYDRCLRAAVAEAVQRGEFVPETPVDDIARVLKVSLSSCGPLTQDSGNFREVEKFLATIARMIQAAWQRPPHTHHSP
ncbi:MAG TPA: TetR/AcrR family transcriptional regulator [Burkholderiaceae bacterium]|nr:TetR/AcrR family transcriptional regulator [Burkholderiaceae bacterium]